MTWKQSRIGNPNSELPFRIKGTIGSVENPPPKAFFKRYVEKNRPVVVVGGLDNWQALSSWNASWLESQIAHPTEVIASTNGLYPDYETQPQPMTKVDMTLAEVWDRVKHPEKHSAILGANETYYVYGKPFLFDSHPDLKGQVPVPACLAETDAQGPNLWLSSPGCTTPAHYDLVNGVLAQIMGRKRVFLFNREQHDHLYQRGAGFPGMDNRERQSQVDIHHPDLSRFPKFAEVEAMTCVLEPGHMLFIPSCWFHEVETLSFSISVGYTFPGGPSVSDFAIMADKLKQQKMDQSDLMASLKEKFQSGQLDMVAMMKMFSQNPQLREELMANPLMAEALRNPELIAKMLSTMGK